MWLYERKKMTMKLLVLASDTHLHIRRGEPGVSEKYIKNVSNKESEPACYIKLSHRKSQVSARASDESM
jgi:hypothetical protein